MDSQSQEETSSNNEKHFPEDNNNNNNNTASSEQQQQHDDSTTITSGSSAKRKAGSSKKSTTSSGSKRKRSSLSRKKGRKRNAAWVVAENEEETFYEVEKIVDRRRLANGEEEFLVRWRGCDSTYDTWEPSDNLCDTAFESAKELAIKRDEEELLGDDNDPEQHHDRNMDDNVDRHPDGDDSVAAFGTEATAIDNQLGIESDDDRKPAAAVHKKSRQHIADETFEDEREKDPVDYIGMEEEAAAAAAQQQYPDPWDWTDAGQIRYRPVERISCHDATARERVAEARVNGIPVCITGHRGWTQFAKKWLKRKSTVIHKDNNMENQQETTNAPIEENNDIDDSPLDLSLPYELDIAAMIEDIGEEAVPVVRRKYNESNPISGEIKAATFLKNNWETQNPKKVLYLHQWQFPRSDTALPKLCGPGKSIPLPNQIIGEDLLKYWLDAEPKHSPYQYLFMGMPGTRSNLHRDNGGLLITIAPIVGEKEVVLVHRADGSGCMYHLAAKLDKPDLHKFPLLSHARVWKTVVKPGEILFLPQGTYHQCLNITPCLSYSRFFLDEVNLRPFLESMMDKDAPEIEHADIIWNAAFELRDRLDKYSDQVRSQIKKHKAQGPLPQEIISTVDTLRALRNVSREVARRFQVKNDIRVKEWDQCVDDIDSTLHDFRYRKSERLPPFRPRRLTLKDALLQQRLTSAVHADEAGAKVGGGGGGGPPMTYLERCFNKAPTIHPDQELVAISDLVKLREKDRVQLSLCNRFFFGTILRIQDRMRAAFIVYEDLPPCHHEYQPFDRLRLPVVGEAKSYLCPNTVRAGMIVIGCEAGEEYRAAVQHCKLATFYLIRLEVKDSIIVDRWVTRDSIMELCSSSTSSPKKSENEDISQPRLGRNRVLSISDESCTTGKDVSTVVVHNCQTDAMDITKNTTDTCSQIRDVHDAAEALSSMIGHESVPEMYQPDSNDKDNACFLFKTLTQAEEREMAANDGIDVSQALPVENVPAPTTRATCSLSESVGSDTKIPLADNNKSQNMDEGDSLVMIETQAVEASSASAANAASVLRTEDLQETSQVTCSTSLALMTATEASETVLKG